MTIHRRRPCNRETVRWYNDAGKYLGWTYKSIVSYREVRSWLLSGNYIKIGKDTFNPMSTTSVLLKHFK